MDYIFLCIIVFLFLLAVFDLVVGVSNDAVNFMTSAIGSGAAMFRRVIIVAGIGVFIGAAMSNGMMDIARHGIFRPEHFSFYELLCIFVAVMITDIILLDVFNTLGMPTSTTVSMVFELLGASFVVSLIKMSSATGDMSFAHLLNTEKAFSVTVGIFLSVAIAFVFGLLVQFLARTIFSFNYKPGLKWKIGLYGGLCSTAIIYFLIVKGLKGTSFVTPEIQTWIDSHTWLIIGVCFAVCTLVMQLLHSAGVNVMKVVVMMGTFALAMAFAGNDLVNFIGVPLSGLSAFQDYAANGAGDPHSFMMDSLNAPADTPIYFLIGAGAVMVFSLATSKKARKVTRTEIGLGSQSGGDEMFGASRLGRRLVRWSMSLVMCVRKVVPENIRRWVGRRFNVNEISLESTAAFDLVRGSVNLVLAGALIAVGTSMKLPLSTTFVTFMVAMGTSLADRAWSRESAVFRITGVISVIGGWFITAGVAFIGAGIVVSAMYWGGTWVMIAMAVLTVVLLIRSNRRFKAESDNNSADALFNAILTNKDNAETWPLLRVYIVENQRRFMVFISEMYNNVTRAFVVENLSQLDKTEDALEKEKYVLKRERRKETLCLRSVSRETAISKSAWFHLSNNCCMSMLYNLRRINEVCREHVVNNFLPLPQTYVKNFENITGRVADIFQETIAVMETSVVEDVRPLRRRCDEIKDDISGIYHSIQDRIREGDTSELTVLYVYMNVLQETQEMVSGIRKYLRAYSKLTERSDESLDRSENSLNITNI